MTATVTIEAVSDRDGSVSWLASGHADGIPFIAEADSEQNALAAACALVYERHAVRKIQAIVRRNTQALPQITDAPRAPGGREWWRVLGVHEGSDGAEIKSAYRRLASEYHPDKGGSRQRMAEINQAYRTALGARRARAPIRASASGEP